jgi:hypothetical protein
MSEAALAWIDSLDTGQRRAAIWPSAPGTQDGDAERHRWFYTPTDHGGLTLRAMSGPQQRLALRLLSTGLSRAGYVTVSTIMGLENVLDLNVGFALEVTGRDRARDPGMYFLRVFGSPEPGGTWSWRFGGHHVSVNHLVVDGVLSSTTPCFLGADPAESPLLGPHFLRPLGAVEDLGRELVRSLDEELLHRALISPRAPLDLVSGNRPQSLPGDTPLTLAEVWRDPFPAPVHDAIVARTRAEEARIGFGPEHVDLIRMPGTPNGVGADMLSGSQQDLLRQLLDTYLGRMPDELAAAEAAKYAGDGLLSLHFAWAGGLEKGQPHYYRIGGPRLMVEYDNAQNGVNHVHSVWRDPEGDFGIDVLGEHLRSHH